MFIATPDGFRVSPAEILRNFSGGYRPAISRYLHDLVLLVHNLRMCFDCDIVLGGYVGSYMQDFIGELAALVSERDPFESGGRYVKCCSLKLESSAVGAALHFVDNFVKTII